MDMNKLLWKLNDIESGVGRQTAYKPGGENADLVNILNKFNLIAEGSDPKQLPADFNPKNISPVLGSSGDKTDPMKGYFFGGESLDGNTPDSGTDGDNVGNTQINLSSDEPTPQVPTESMDGVSPDTKSVLEGFGDNPVSQAITNRIIRSELDLLSQYGPEFVMNAIDEVADFVGDVDEIGTSDVSAWVDQVKKILQLKGNGDLEEGLMKNIKRGLQGWYADATDINGEKMTPRDVVRRNKNYDDETLQRISKAVNGPGPGFPFSNAKTKHSPADLQKRVLDREMKKRGFSEQDVDEGYDIMVKRPQYGAEWEHEMKMDGKTKHTYSSKERADAVAKNLMKGSSSQYAVAKSVKEGYRIMPNIDRERYTDLSGEGLEGPFQTNDGRIVYYDPKAGQYYDRDTDMYLDHDEVNMTEDEELADISKIDTKTLQSIYSLHRHHGQTDPRSKAAAQRGYEELKRRGINVPPVSESLEMRLFKELHETASVTDYNPKSQGGTRKELIAKYQKSKSPKDAEAARKAGATQKELQGVSEAVANEDVVSAVKKTLGDYLKSLDDVKSDSDLKDKVEKAVDVLGPVVKSIMADNGKTIKVHGNEDDGFRVSIQDKPSKSTFKSVDEAVMAVEMFNARQRARSVPVEIDTPAEPARVIRPAAKRLASKIAPVVQQSQDYVDEK